MRLRGHSSPVLALCPVWGKACCNPGRTADALPYSAGVCAGVSAGCAETGAGPGAGAATGTDR